MNWQEFEDRLKAEAQAHQTPVDTDALWDKIREKKRRRLPFFWWLTGLGTLLLGGWLAMIYFSGNNSSFPQEAIVLLPLDTIVTTEIISSNKIDTASLHNSSHKEITQKITDDIQYEPTAPNQLTAVSQPSSNNTISYNDISKSVLKKPVRKSVRVKETIIPSANMDYSNIAALSSTSAEGLTKDSISNNSSQTPVEQNLSNELVITDKIFVSDSSFTLTLSFLTTDFLPLSSILPNNPLSPVFVPVLKKETDKNQSHAYIGVQAGYYFWKVRQDSIRTDEKPLSSRQIGLQVQLPIGRSWSVRTGVQYTQFVSVFRWSRKWEETRDLPIPNYYVNGNIDTTYTTALYRYERNVQHYNRLQSISIPLDVQYRIALKDWALRPSAGAQIQVWQKADGVILEGNEPNAQDYTAIYQRAFNLGLRVGLALEIPLGQRTRLSLEPAGILDVTRRTKGIYPAERFQQWGVNVGILRQL